MAEVSEKIVTSAKSLEKLDKSDSKQPKYGHRRFSGGNGVKIPNSRAASLDNAVIERKNKQLNQTTRQLEEKVKSLQERSKTRSLPRVSKEKPPPRANSAPPRELPGVPSKLSLEKRRGSTVTSRIREREAEFQKQVQDREEQITHLKDRLTILSQKLIESKEKDHKFPKDPRDREKVLLTLKEDGVELQNVLKQVTKERLQLERHLQIANDSLQRNNGVDLQKYITLEQSNQYLRQQLDSLDLLQQEHKLVEIQYREKEEACRELMNTLKYKSALCADLESQLAKVIEKNTQLTMANSDLQKKVVELHGVSEECATLKENLEKVQTDCHLAKSEVTNLNGKVRNLESVLAEMHKAAENRREIERQHKEALENLKRKQEEVEHTATKKQAEIIEQLKIKITDLEVDRNAQNERHQELILEMAEMKKYGPESIASDMEAPCDNLEIDQIMAKLEQDNKFLEDLEKQRSSKAVNKANSDSSTSSSSSNNQSTNSSNNQSPTSLPRTSSAITDSGFLSQSSLSSPGSRLLAVASSSSNGSLHRLPGVTGADKINLLNGGSYQKVAISGSGSGSTSGLDKAMTSKSMDMGTFIEKDGSIEVPGKGWCFVHISRYSYDPFQHSPNDSPEAELQVNAGDYILVWGDVDEDGFFDGEMLDGRRGLVPSNFVEKLEGEELFDFHQQVVLGLGDCDDSVCTSIPQDLDFMSSDEALEADRPLSKRNKSFTHSEPNQQSILQKTSLPQYASCTDLDMTEDEGDVSEVAHVHSAVKGQVPCPRLLTFEPQHNRSVVIGWSPPDVKANFITSYQVIIDSSVHANVPVDEVNGLKATINNLDLSYIHRMSVKCVTRDNKLSNEAGCTMVIGKDAPLRPTLVKAAKVTSTSVTISWIPSNTNFMHAIIVNNCEVKTVKQGVFKHSLAGLSPNTTYKVKVRAKNLKAASYLSDNFNSLSSGVLEVTTKPKGLPDPPLDLQVIKGPREGTVAITWLPVTINPSGTSNGAPVLGYIIYADGKKVSEVNTGTADQAVIEISPSASNITMRTKTGDEDMSVESESCKIPISVKASLIKKTQQSNKVLEIIDGDEQDDHDLPNGLGHHQQNGSNNTKMQPTREVVINYSGYPELDSDIGPSELSDIAEEPEEGLTSEDEGSEGSRGSTPKIVNNLTANPNLSISAASNVSSSIVSSTASLNSLTRWSNSSLYTSGNGNTTSQNNQITPILSTNLSKTTVQQTLSNQSSGSTPTLSTTNHQPSTTKVHINGSHPNSLTTTSSSTSTLSSSTFDPFSTNNSTNSTNPFSTNNQTANNANASKPIGTYIGTSMTIESAAVSSKNNGQNSVKIRIFVALFDYDPPTMSPNPDACDEELPFREGQLIKVHGEKDADGFYWGEAGGAKGYVPCNMVSEVQVDDDRVAEELFKEQSGSDSGNTGNGNSGNSGNGGNGNKVKVTTSSSTSLVDHDERWGDIYEDMPAKRKLALYDYDPVELSPNVDAEVELSFRAGDIILVYGEMDDDGFFMGEINGRRGLVPSNFLTDVPSGYIFMDQNQQGSSAFPYSTQSTRSQPSSNQQPRILGTQRRW